MQRFRTGRFGCIEYWDIWCSGNKQRRHPQTAPDVRQPSTELLKVGESVAAGRSLSASALVVLAAWTVGAGALAALVWQRVLAR